MCGEAEEVGKRGEVGWLEMQMNSPALKATEVHLLLKAPYLPSPSLSAISEVLFNTRGSRHTNSIPFANAAAAAERLPKKIQDSCSVQNTLPPSKVRFSPKTNTILKHALQLPQMPNKAKEF